MPATSVSIYIFSIVKRFLDKQAVTENIVLAKVPGFIPSLNFISVCNFIFL